MSARPTDASDGFCSDGEPTDESDWPTPTASDYGSSQNGICAGKPSGGTPPLSTLARTTWATPTCSDAHGATAEPRDRRNGAMLCGQAVWPTPLSSDEGPKMQGEARPHGVGNPNLPMAASMWSTACTTDAASSGRATTTTDVMHPGTSLTDAMRSSFSITDGRPVPPTKKGGRGGMVLDPRFVEALMGFPDGWTVPDSPRDFAALASELLETRSSASRPSTPSRSSSLALFADDDEER